MTFDVLAIGDTTVDVFLALGEVHVACDINQKNCELCMAYADKIPVEKLTFVPGVGNAANHAVGVRRLGLTCALVSILGRDSNGEACLRSLDKEKVTTDYIAFDQKKGTNYSTVITLKEERTILVYHEERSYRLPELPSSQWMYFTSMGKGHEKMFPNVLRYLKDNGAKLAFNPGTFQLKLGLQALKPLLAETSILFVNKEEAIRLLHRELPIKELLKELHALGCEVVVITDGQAGSYCFDGAQAWSMGIYDARVVERTGCGDAYASGFTAALISGQPLTEAMRWGSINASGVIQYVGAQQGLYKKAAMQKVLKQAKRFTPRRFF